MRLLKDTLFHPTVVIPSLQLSDAFYKSPFFSLM